MTVKRFTQDMVRTVANHAGELSGDWFGVSVGGNIGHGVRYISKTNQTVWLGSRGARESASYFLGIIDSLNTGGVIGDLPASVNEVRAMLTGPGGGWSERWASQGYADAQSRMRYLESRRG